MYKKCNKILVIICMVLMLTATVGQNTAWAKKYNVGYGKTLTLKGKVYKGSYWHWNGRKETIYILRLNKNITFVSPDKKVKTKEVQLSLSKKQYKKIKKKKKVKLRGMVFLTDYELIDQWVRPVGMSNVRIK